MSLQTMHLFLKKISYVTKVLNYIHWIWKAHEHYLWLYQPPDLSRTVVNSYGRGGWVFAHPCRQWSAGEHGGMHIAKNKVKIHLTFNGKAFIDDIIKVFWLSMLFIFIKRSQWYLFCWPKWELVYIFNNEYIN